MSWNYKKSFNGAQFASGLVAAGMSGMIVSTGGSLARLETLIIITLLPRCQKFLPGVFDWIGLVFKDFNYSYLKLIIIQECIKICAFKLIKWKNLICSIFEISWKYW